MNTQNPTVELRVAIGDREPEPIVIELYPDMAPKTVANFLSLVEKGFYDGLIFHRVIRGFMIQGGGMLPDFSERECDTIYGEFAVNGFMQNTLRHTRGVISMARTQVPDSASSQFFIMHQDAPHLDGQYAAFGKVTDGMATVDRIAGVRTGRMGWYTDVPRETCLITSAKIINR